MSAGLPFVERQGIRLTIGDDDLRLLGTNCYFLQEEGARAALGWEGYEGRVAEALDKIAGLGMNLVRAWAFNDDPDNPAALQPRPGVLSETGCAGVDRALELAGRLRLRLVLCLGNYWPDYGGVRQYLRWHGLDPDRPELFFTDRAVRAHYAEHVDRLLRRRNPRTGRSWGEEPAVLAWELLNEPRGAGLDPAGEQLADWVREMAGVVRCAAPRALVSAGEEGLGDGCLPEKFSSAVDLLSCHLYPEEWRWPDADLARAGCQWISRHAKIARRLGRPLLLGEFGLRRQGRDLAERRRIYDAWLDCACGAAGLAAAASWSFSTDDRPEQWDDYDWRWETGSRPADPRNRYADLHQRWAEAFRRRTRS